jgi:hypothetical protein
MNQIDKIIKDVRARDKRMAKIENDSLLNLLDAYIKDCEEHIKKHDYDIGVQTGKLKAFRLIKNYILENNNEEQNNTD